MSMSGAEKAGLAGGVLLAGGLVAAAVLVLLPGGGLGRRGKPDPEPEVPVAETVTAPRVPDDPGGAEPDGPRTEPETAADLRREINRLRSAILEKDQRIEALEAKLKEAGISLTEEAEDPAETAAAALARLRACGPETSPTDIDVLVEEIVVSGRAGVETVVRFLEQRQDTRFSDTWQYIAGRFTAYPTLRIALLDTLRQIGGVEGQAALVGILRETTDPLETLVLIAMLHEIRDVPTVEEVRIQAARQYTEGEPARRELLFRGVFLEVLSDQPSAIAVRDLEAFARRPRGPDESAEAALRRIAEIDAPEALDALARAASEEEGGPLARTAADTLCGRRGAGAVARLREILGNGAPAVRQVIYRNLLSPLGDELRELKRLGSRGGLEAQARFERLTEERDARAALLESRKDAEEDPDARRDLDQARKDAADLADRIAALAADMGGR